MQNIDDTIYSQCFPQILCFFMANTSVCTFSTVRQNLLSDQDLLEEMVFPVEGFYFGRFTGESSMLKTSMVLWIESSQC